MFTCQVATGDRREGRCCTNLDNLDATSVLKFKLRLTIVYDVNNFTRIVRGINLS